MSDSLVELALAADPADLGALLLGLPEGQWYDRKSGRTQAKDVARTLVAMGNAEGGYVVIGLGDGKVTGVDPRRVNELRQAGFDHTEPPVRVHPREVECALDDGTSGAVLVLRVDPGETVHTVTNGDCYLRVGDESRKLSFAQQQELQFDRGAAPYDGTSSGVDVSALWPQLVEEWRTATGATVDAEHLLASRSLLTARGDATVAAYLLFGQHPQDRYPHAYVRVLRYVGIERGAGRRQHLAADGDVRCEGPVPQVLREAEGAITRLMPLRRVLGTSGRFADEPLIPRDAWLEGVVNAVVHRSYSAAGDGVRVEIFDDRVEISSPGRFPGIVDPAQPLRITRYARNPRIARACTDLRITQELGEGIRRIFEEMQRRGLTDPVYEQSAGAVRLVLSSADAIAPDVRARLPRGARETLDVLRRAKRPLGTGEVMELLRVSRPKAKRDLEALRDEGLVSWDGKSAKDPRATWSAV